MNGSCSLTDAAIDDMVCRTSPGNYALGYMDGSTFTAFYTERCLEQAQQLSGGLRTAHVSPRGTRRAL